jgi:hypothetical protein
MHSIKNSVMLNKDLLLKSDYFPFLSKKKNNKQLLPMKLSDGVKPGSQDLKQ